MTVFKVAAAVVAFVAILVAAFVVPIGGNGGVAPAGVGAGGVVGVVCRAPGSAPSVIAAPAAAAVPAGSVKSSIPIVGRFLITSNFGPRWGRPHNGIDLATSANEPTLAFTAGTVAFAGMNGGAGNMVKLDHGGGVETVYMHHSQITVSKGDRVAAGQQIGVQGTTGDSTGPHLHFEVHVNGVPVDPRPYLAGIGLTLPPEGSWGVGPAAPGAASPGGAVPAAAAGLPECTPEQMSPVAAVAPQAGPGAPGGVSAAAVPEWALPWVVKAGALCPEIPPAIVAAQVDQESQWNPKAVNPNSGASGLSQFMPGTWPGVGRDDDGNGVVSPFDIGDAIMAQGRYGCQMVDLVRGAGVPGDPTDLALAAYNAGPANVLNHRGIPPFKETQDYVPLIRGMAAGKYAETR